MENAQHLMASVREKLLGIAGVRHGLPLLRVAGLDVSGVQLNIVKNSLEFDMAKRGVGYIAHEDPTDFEDTLPLVRCPDSAASRQIDLKVAQVKPIGAPRQGYARGSASLPFRKSGR